MRQTVSQRRRAQGHRALSARRSRPAICSSARGRFRSIRKTMEMVGASDVRAQAKQVMENLRRGAAGRRRVVRQRRQDDDLSCRTWPTSARSTRSTAATSRTRRRRGRRCRWLVCRAARAESQLGLGILVLGALIGMIASGQLTDRLLKAGMIHARMWVPTVCYFAAVVFLIPRISAPHVPLAVVRRGGVAFISAASPPLDAARRTSCRRACGSADSARMFLRSWRKPPRRSCSAACLSS